MKQISITGLKVGDTFRFTQSSQLLELLSLDAPYKHNGTTYVTYTTVSINHRGGRGNISNNICHYPRNVIKDEYFRQTAYMYRLTQQKSDGEIGTKVIITTNKDLQEEDCQSFITVGPVAICNLKELIIDL